MTRREFVGTTVAGAASLASLSAEGIIMEPLAAKLPRWRGFNLLEKFTLQQNAPFRESDFDIIKEWGFDFVRLPNDYRCWTEAPGAYKESALKEIDQAVEWGRQRKIHV